MSTQSSIHPANRYNRHILIRIFPVLLLAVLLISSFPDRADAQDRWFGPDKILHFVGSFVVTSAGYIVAYNAWDWEYEKALRFGIGLGVGASLAKEIYDELTGRSYFSGKDLVWDGLGIGAGVLFVDALYQHQGGRGGHEADVIGISLRLQAATTWQPVRWQAPVRLPKSVDTGLEVPTFGLPSGDILYYRNRKGGD